MAARFCKCAWTWGLSKWKRKAGRMASGRMCLPGRIPRRPHLAMAPAGRHSVARIEFKTGALRRWMNRVRTSGRFSGEYRGYSHSGTRVSTRPLLPTASGRRRRRPGCLGGPARRSGRQGEHAGPVEPRASRHLGAAPRTAAAHPSAGRLESARERAFLGKSRRGERLAGGMDASLAA